MPELGIYKTRSFPHSPTRVYETWIDVNVRVPPIVEMSADVQPGGDVRIVIETGGRRSVMEGKYLEVESAERLRYTWQWTDTPGETIVEVKFQPAEMGCRLTLTHEGFSTPGQREAHAIAWDAYLRQIGNVLEAKANQLASR